MQIIIRERYLFMKVLFLIIVAFGLIKYQMAGKKAVVKQKIILN